MTSSIFDALTPAEVARISAAGTPLTLPAGLVPDLGADPRRQGLHPRPRVRSPYAARRRDRRPWAPAQIIGEAAIVNRSLRTATIVALTPLEVIHFTSEAARAPGRARCRPSREALRSATAAARAPRPKPDGRGIERPDDRRPPRSSATRSTTSRPSCSAGPHPDPGRGRRAGRRAARARPGAVAAARLRPPSRRRRSPSPTATCEALELHGRPDADGHPGPRLAGRAGAHLGSQLRPAGGVADLACWPAWRSRDPTPTSGWPSSRPGCCPGWRRCSPTSGAATSRAPPAGC